MNESATYQLKQLRSERSLKKAQLKAAGRPDRVEVDSKWQRILEPHRFIDLPEGIPEGIARKIQCPVGFSQFGWWNGNFAGWILILER